MPLIKDVARACRRLAPLGWGKLLAAHGLDITKADLAKELARPLPQIDRTLPGFEDFGSEGARGVEPGSPARSLLYHALASPAVRTRPGGKLRGYPTLAELEAVENYVFASRRVTLDSLRKIAGNHPIAIAVFAVEYRTAPRTAHRRYADLTVARTGLARVGTAPARYDPEQRGFTALVTGHPGKIRVSPARYSAFLAVKLPGSKAAGRPMRFRGPEKHEHLVGDDHRGFWVPLHKLFSGGECLIDVPDLSVELVAHHVNEKLRRIHLALAHRRVEGKQFDSGWAEPDIAQPPFRFSEGIAEFGDGADDPAGLLVPVPHRSLVQPATYQGRPLGFHVPSRDGFVGSLDLTVEHNSEGEEIRPAPAYVHARTKMTDDAEVDLNQFSDVADLVDRGGYRARHYLDFTGEGWVEAQVAWGKKRPPRWLGQPLAAYSLVTAPDFLFACDQAELSDWSDSLPESVSERLWYIAPTPLSDVRLPANLQMPGSPFAVDDNTITAVVPIGIEPALGTPVTHAAQEHPVHTSLPDDAAGVMAPGWEVARDWLPDKREHLATYGLGSPFPEDSKLCAAISSFWPAVAPDATRQFAWSESRHDRTVAPLTDHELGRGDHPLLGRRASAEAGEARREGACVVSEFRAHRLRVECGRQSALARAHRPDHPA